VYRVHKQAHFISETASLGAMFCRPCQNLTVFNFKHIMQIGAGSVHETYLLDGNVLPSSFSCKDLRVLVDSNLTPSSHIASATVTAN